ncbi:MAG TPA: sugar ABC transporter substrate-binding protein [Thermoanaerobaculia bacterium]|nr:sugar ABC transporter substrate-binding protein [Thermoanaerobaculia bacterium]
MARPARALIALGAALLAVACSRGGTSDRVHTVHFWGLGREGEVVKELVPEFERENPGIRVVVQQIPWTAAHEKLLTGFVGGSPPDLAQLGNTWIPEFAAIGALEPLEARISGSRAISPDDYFEGIWKTNLFDGATYGIPWYVDTRVLFYRRDLLAAAGYPEVPRTWSGWREAMLKVRAAAGGSRYAILLPTNEWEQLTIFGLQERSPLLGDGDTRGAFARPPFSAAADWYVGLFRDGLAPVVSYTQLGNPYQEFSRGYIAMWITGPWNLGEFRRRLPPELQDTWMTAPVPAPDGQGEWPGYSLAGGSSLALFRASKEKDAAWRFVEFLSRPSVQTRFYALSGDLPARRASWEDPALSGDVKARAFRDQLARVTPLPRVPEWEQIAQKVWEDLEAAIRGRETVAASLSILDRDVDRILEKRRWMLARAEARRGH